MADFILACSSTVDQPESFLKERGIRYISFSWISDDGTVHPDDLGKSVSFPEFYRRMRNGSFPTTSQPNFQDFRDFFEPFLREGKDILYVAVSSGISGACGTARSAAESLLEDYPDRTLFVVDSRNASPGYALLMDGVYEQQRAGHSIEECRDWILMNRDKADVWFFTTDLTWYIHGGRIKPVAGLVGKLLNICLVLTVDRAGTLIPKAKVRGKVRAVQLMLQNMESNVRGGLSYSGKVFLVHSDWKEEAERIRALIEARFQRMVKPVIVSSIGCVIGSHSGPGTIAVAFWGEKEH